jgi:hypothetical protein
MEANESDTDKSASNVLTPEMLEKFKKFVKREEKKNEYNRIYMQKRREDKEAYNKYQRELYRKKTSKPSEQ